MKCPLCDADLPDGTERCRYCGQAIQQAPRATPEQPVVKVQVPGTPPGQLPPVPPPDPNRVPGGIRCARVILIVQAVFGLLFFCGGVVLVASAWGLTSPELRPPDFALSVALAGGIVLTPLLVSWLLPTLAVSALRRRGRILATIVGIISLPMFPLGTAFGILILMGIYDAESTVWIRAQQSEPDGSG